MALTLTPGPEQLSHLHMHGYKQDKAQQQHGNSST
jgi:hypothetical protein